MLIYLLLILDNKLDRLGTLRVKIQLASSLVVLVRDWSVFELYDVNTQQTIGVFQAGAKVRYQQMPSAPTFDVLDLYRKQSSGSKADLAGPGERFCCLCCYIDL